MLRRCKEYNISAVLWDNRFDSKASVVICSVDAVTGGGYRDFVSAYARQNRIVRIVVDEVHLIALWRFFRDFELIACRLRPNGVTVPLVLTTATAPPCLVEELRGLLGAADCCFKLIRMSSGRRNLSYRVVPIEIRSMDDMTQKCASLLESESQSASPYEKLIAYCLTVSEAEKLGSVLRQKMDSVCLFLYYGTMSSEERKISFEGWMSTEASQSQVMIATSAFSCGIDYPAVRTVLHVGGSRSLVEFSQESGRAGRDGVTSKSIVIYNEKYYAEKTRAFEDLTPGVGITKAQATASTAHELKFGSFVGYATSTHDCRRQLLENFIDGTERGPCENTEEKCDNCESGSNERPIVTGRKEEQNGMNVLAESQKSKRSNQLSMSALCSPLSKRQKVQASSSAASVVITDEVRWKTQQLSKMNCVICAVPKPKMCDRENHDDCLRGICFRCMERFAKHQSRDCNVTPRGMKGVMRCFFCGIPKCKDIHAPGTFNVKGKCEWVYAKNAVLLLWREKRMKRKLFEAAPILKKCGNDLEAFGRLICGGFKSTEKVWLVSLIPVIYDELHRI